MMSKKQLDQSIYDIAVDAADEIGDTDLMWSVRQLRDQKSVQVARAKAVLKELLAGLPERSPDELDNDSLDAIDDGINAAIQKNLDADSIWDFIWVCCDHVQVLRSTHKARMMANALHNQPGGTRDKRAAIVAAWATGKYTSRDICAEQECGALGMSFSTARKALIGVPKPT